ncbi:hypothetical protein [Pedobacter nutrimenti]|jgi:hypothetical protein|uniref:Uncharacterized protein n=1 Tax=Pedobacter nutrimenti TaxID=1241337 RepID=A0A318UL88_9SPHI|nr:hypothetical protein [Pedobacter nutrimenti]PYF75878.1 hypothetical protein B0O44_102433 [Pedobacter nutrimenti]
MKKLFLFLGIAICCGNGFAQTEAKRPSDDSITPLLNFTKGAQKAYSALITVSALSYADNDVVRMVKIYSDLTYSQDITVSGYIQAYNSLEQAIPGGGSFSILLPAGQSLAQQDVYIGYPADGFSKYRIVFVTSDPAYVDGNTITFNVNPVF